MGSLTGSLVGESSRMKLLAVVFVIAGALADPEADADAWYGAFGYSTPYALGSYGYGGLGYGYGGYGYAGLGYGGYGYGRGYWKRSADAEPEAEADADAWYETYGYAAPYAIGAYGYTGLGYAGLGYASLGYGGYGYGGLGYGRGYWKRSADAEPEAA